MKIEPIRGLNFKPLPRKINYFKSKDNVNGINKNNIQGITDVLKYASEFIEHIAESEDEQIIIYKFFLKLVIAIKESGSSDYKLVLEQLANFKSVPGTIINTEA